MNSNEDNLYIPTQVEYDILLLKSLNGESLTYYEQELMRKFEIQQEQIQLAEEGQEFQKVLRLRGNKDQTEVFDLEPDEEQAGAISSIIIILIVLCVGLFAAFVLLGFIS